MIPAFTTALYYLGIDIKNEAWLKNAMLYWEKIRTIVPSSIEQPYFFEPSMKEISELKDDISEYFESQDGIKVLMDKEISGSKYTHPGKLPCDIKELMNQNIFRYVIRNDLEQAHCFQVPSRFQNFYMTLLATQLSEKFESCA